MDDLSKQDNTLQLIEPNKDKPKEFDNLEGVYDMDTTTDDTIYSEMFGIGDSDEIASRPRPLQSFVDYSMSLCALVVGPTNGDKTRHFQGSNEDEHGMIGWVADQLFIQLQEKEDAAQNQYKATVSVSFQEHYGEIITDLLNPTNRELSIKIDPAFGYCVHGITKHVVTSAEELKAKLDYGKNSRNVAMFSTGPATESTGGIFEIVLKQEEGDSPNSMQTMQSRLLFVDTPPTTPLVAGAEKTRKNKGPDLAKALFSFVDVCKALASRQKRMNAPFEQSTFTTVLHDSLGADSLVICLGTLCQGEPEVSSKTMKLLSNFKKINNYPIENTELTQGIMIKYRTAISNLLDRIEELKVEHAAAPKEDKAAIERLKMLEESLLKANHEGTTAKEDGAKVYRMLELFKAKYSKLVEDKAKQAEELILSEEQKLEISKALLDLKLEFSEANEKFQNEKYALELKASNKETQLQDTQIKLTDTMNLLKDSQTAEEEARKAQIEMQQELQKKVNECIALGEKYKASKESGTGLGTEVATLVNQKEQFTKMNASLNAQLETAVAKISDLEAEVSKNEEAIERLDEDSARIKAELEETHAQKSKVELELKKKEVGFEQARLDIEKNTENFVRQREHELFSVRKASEEEVAAIRREKDEIIRTNNKLEGQVRGLTRKIRDMENNIQRIKDESYSKNTNSKRLEAQLNDARESYRSKLLSYLGEEAMAAKLAADDISKFIDGEDQNKDDKQGDDKEATTASSMAAANSRAALEDLIKTYKTREKDLLAQMEKIKEVNDENKKKNRLLFDSYHKLKDQLEDATDGQLEVKDLPPEKEMKITESQLEKERDDELAALRQAVAQMRSDGAIQKDRAVELSQSYREMVQQQEEKLKELASKMAHVQAENDRLTKEREEQKDQATLKALETNMEEMQKNILEQIQNVKIEAPEIDYSQAKKKGRRDEGGGGADGAAGGSRAIDLELQNLRIKVKKQKKVLDEQKQFKNENTSLKDEINKMKLKLIEARGSGTGKGVSDKEGGDASLLRKQLHETEIEKHQMATKITMLSEELEAYKNYMKQTVSKYKNEIAALRKLQNAGS